MDDTMRRLGWPRSAGTLRPTPLPVVGLVWVLIFFLPCPAFSQIQRTVGVHLGQARSHQTWDGPIATENAHGFILGVNVEVPTPVSFLSIRAELSYVRRGSSIWDEVLDPEGVAPAFVRSHYLNVPIVGKVNLRLGPSSLYLFAGPAFDLLLETECSQDLCGVLFDERPTVFAVTFGSGVSVDLWDRYRAGLELRVTEGLSSAYVAASSDVRYRSLELLIRASFPFGG